MLLERCETRADDDGQPRSIRALLLGGARAAVGTVNEKA
jgi:hypothetical protein